MEAALIRRAAEERLTAPGVGEADRLVVLGGLRQSSEGSQRVGGLEPALIALDAQGGVSRVDDEELPGAPVRFLGPTAILHPSMRLGGGAGREEFDLLSEPPAQGCGLVLERLRVLLPFDPAGADTADE
jgi:hypothetical protein